MNPCPECEKQCASRAGLAAHRRTHGIGVTAGQKTAPRHPDPDPIPQVTIAFSAREWTTITHLAKTRNVTPTAIIRACVQHTVTTSTPNPFNEQRPNAALVVTDPTGTRICPDCGAQLVKKNPHGPGRFPDRCPDPAKSQPILVSAQSAAEHYGVHHETLRRLYRAGTIPGYKIGRHLKFDLEELREAFRTRAASRTSSASEWERGAGQNGNR